METKSGAQRLSRSPKHPTDNVSRIRQLISEKNDALLDHPYFRLCDARKISRSQIIEVMKQVYCFSIFFERLLTRRIADCSSFMDARLLQLARGHLRDELGHVQLFHECLTVNGVSMDELAGLEPTMFTRTVFGYLLATIQHENEYVANVAIMQAMESIGCHFFSATLKGMQAHSMVADAIKQHSEDDAEHAELGLDLIAYVDEKTMKDCGRVIDEVYRLMSLMFEEWLVPSREIKISVSQRKRRSGRPPRVN